MKKNKIAVTSGGFDPIHSGHIEYLNHAKKHGDKLVVLLNGDEWLKNKKGSFFMPFTERKIILESLTIVDEVLNFEDDEKGSCINGLKDVQNRFPDSEVIFCNGGDRTKTNIPEMELSDITFKFGVGGNYKKNSSSLILKNWLYDKESRIWGEFFNLFVEENIKVKELVIHPKKGMSFQRHSHRNELWFVSKGSCLVNYSKNSENKKKQFHLNENDTFHIKKNEWHQLINPNNENCKIIEIQYGEMVEESDIERLYYFDEKNLEK